MSDKKPVLPQQTFLIPRAASRQALIGAMLNRANALAALKLSLVVGTVLNLLNQSDGLLGGAGLSWFNVLCNYLVPFCVSAYSAARNEMRRNGGECR